MQIGGGAHKFERLGLAKAFKYSGHEVALWNPDGKSPYDQFDEFTPDLFIGNGFELSEALINVLLENPEIRCWLKLGDFGSAYNDKCLDGFNILMASENEKINISRLTKKLRVWGGAHYWAGRKDTHSYWENYGVIPLHSTLGCDVFSYCNNSRVIEAFKCDFGMISGLWPYKEQTASKYLYPLMYPDNAFNIKIFGYGWGTPYYCGPADEAAERHILKSQSISINLHEPHALDKNLGWELNERSFKLLGNGCFIVSDKPKDLAEHIFNNNEIAFAENPAEFRELIEYYLKYPDKKQAFIDRGYAKVMASETYFHRIAYLMANIFGDIEEKNVLDSYEKAKKELIYNE